MRRFALLSSLLAAGCLGSSVEGVWLFDQPFPEGEDDPCAESGTENFLTASFDDAVVPDSDWTFTESAGGSDALFFGQIETTTAGAAVLTLDGEVYPGTEEDGVWVFTWSDLATTEDGAAHTAGYERSESTEVSSEIRFRFTPDGATATGEVEVATEDRWSTTESDSWSADDVGLPIGTIDTRDLEPDDGGGNVTNRPDEDDCEGDLCELTLTTACSSSSRFTATRTDHDVDAYEYLADAGQ